FLIFLNISTITTFLTHTFCNSLIFESFYDHWSTTLGTFILYRFVPGYKVTARVFITSIENSTFFRSFLNYFTTTAWTFDVYLFNYRLSIFTIRVTWTCQKSTKSSVFDHHVSSAFFADYITDFILDLDFI